MHNPIIEKTIKINASPQNVWKVFTKPEVTRRIGGEYVTDWRTGSSFGWKGLDNNMHTAGIILELEPARLLKHNLCDMTNSDLLLSVITYEFKEANGATIVYAKEEMNAEMTENQLKEASEGWDFALQSIKEVAEKLD